VGAAAEVIWQYLDLYFATQTRDETLRLGLSMVLDDIIDEIRCPVLLYHASRDTISLPDVAERYRAALSHTHLNEHRVDDTHGCMLHLKSTITPSIVAWCEATLASGNRG
jgi:pimeloyl-ACP methyl ester carboxylesterase